MTYFAKHKLSPMETRVCELLVTGLTPKEIAAKLFRAPKTIYTIRRRARNKLGVTNDVQLLLNYLDSVHYPDYTPEVVRELREAA